MQTKHSNDVLQITHTSRSHKWNLLVWFIVFGMALGVDFASRIVCFKSCDISLFSWLGLHPFANSYFAFSLPIPVPLMYGIYALVVVVLVGNIVASWKKDDSLTRMAWLFIFAGAIGNIVERIWLGYVRDFIQIGTGYLNLADIYIICGVVSILYRALRRK